jgi:hypothetical protein
LLGIDIDVSEYLSKFNFFNKDSSIFFTLLSEKYTFNIEKELEIT